MPKPKQQVIQWIAAKTIAAVRSGERSRRDVASRLGSTPVVDELRILAERTDIPHFVRLVDDREWWHRYLGVTVARRLVGDSGELPGLVRARWNEEEATSIRNWP